MDQSIGRSDREYANHLFGQAAHLKQSRRHFIPYIATYVGQARMLCCSPSLIWTASKLDTDVDHGDHDGDGGVAGEYESGGGRWQK